MILVFWSSLIQNGPALMLDHFQKHFEHPIPELQYYMMEQVTCSGSISLISSWEKYPLGKDGWLLFFSSSKPELSNLSGFADRFGGRGDDPMRATGQRMHTYSFICPSGGQVHLSLV